MVVGLRSHLLSGCQLGTSPSSWRPCIFLVTMPPPSLNQHPCNKSPHTSDLSLSLSLSLSPFCLIYSASRKKKFPSSKLYNPAKPFYFKTLIAPSGWVLFAGKVTHPQASGMDGWEDIIGPFCFSWVVLGFPIQWWVVLGFPIQWWVAGWGRAERANPAIIRSDTACFAQSLANQVTSIGPWP